MPMTKDEFNAAVTDILQNVGDAGHVSQKLDELRTAFGEEITAKESSLQEVEQLKKDKQSLQEANMNLFLKIGTPVKDDENNTPKEEAKNETPDFDALFDESGNLKKE